MFKKAKRTNKERDWIRFKHLRRSAQKTCRNTHNRYIHDVISSQPMSNRSKELGALVKSKRFDNSGVVPLKDGGLMHSDPKTKANILNRQFTSVFSKDNDAPVPNLGDACIPPMDSIEVSLNVSLNCSRI